MLGNADAEKRSHVAFKKHFFDLVICVSVLAHVVSPRDLIAKIASVMKPG